jgi:hypothetical protein
MSNQQFAEPEWQDSRGSNINADSREQQMYNPQGINVDPREKIQPQSAPGRRKSRLWLWILIGVIVVALAGSGIDEAFGTFTNTSTETHTYQVGSQSLPTLVIHDNTGSITIQKGGDNSQVTITAIKRTSAFNNAPTVAYSKNNSTITADEQGGGNFLGFSSVDFEVTVPSNANLQIHSDTGEIQVSDINGAMSLTTNTSAIVATQDTLSGHSVLHSDTGSVTFNGSLAPHGNYEMSTNTGSVDVTLPRDAAFHVDASTNTGTFSSNFPNLNADHPNTVGRVVHGNVGNAPTANLTLKTNTDSINIHYA